MLLLGYGARGGSGRGAGDVHTNNRGNPNSRTGSRTPCGYHERARQGGAIGRSWVSAPAGLKNKDLVGIPWMVAFALRAAGWWLRADIIWHKPSCMPESVEDRPTKSHEYIFLLSKSLDYYYDHEAIKEPAAFGSKGSHFDKGKTAEHQLGRASRKPRKSKIRGEFAGKTAEQTGRESFRAITETRNKRSVWTVATSPYAGAHFACYPPPIGAALCDGRLETRRHHSRSLRQIGNHRKGRARAGTLGGTLRTESRLRRAHPRALHGHAWTGSLGMNPISHLRSSISAASAPLIA